MTCPAMVANRTSASNGSNLHGRSYTDRHDEDWLRPYENEPHQYRESQRAYGSPFLCAPNTTMRPHKTSTNQEFLPFIRRFRPVPTALREEYRPPTASSSIAESAQPLPADRACRRGGRCRGTTPAAQPCRSWSTNPTDRSSASCRPQIPNCTPRPSRP
jgi:hypothetical protein